MLKKRAALLATVVSLGGVAGVMGALASGAQAKGKEDAPSHDVFLCAPGGLVTGFKAAEALVQTGSTCEDPDSP